jgi:hypothetical protein
MILAIDTVKDKKFIALYWPGRIAKFISWRSNKIDLLKKIDQLLCKNNLSKKDVSCLVVNRGPGSFTGIRQGISLANTFRYVFKIPVIGFTNQKTWPIIKMAEKGYKNLKKNDIDKMISPYYGKEPNITAKKKRSNIF